MLVRSLLAASGIVIVGTASRVAARNPQFLELLGSTQLADLSTSLIRNWHRVLTTHTSQHVARVAKKHLRTALMLVAEDFQITVPTHALAHGTGKAAEDKKNTDIGAGPHSP